jgi:hypothetical protein
VAGKTPTEAVAEFVEPIQEALGCFLKGKVTADSRDERRPGKIVLSRNDPVQLYGPKRITIEISMDYELRRTDEPDKGPWKVSTTGWIYHLREHSGELIVGYHWHPRHTPQVPHAHIRTQSTTGHFPTGRVLIEDLLQAAIEQGAEPTDPERWKQVRARNLEAFHRGATWGHSPGWGA